MGGFAALGRAADDRLLELALSRPNEAMAAARAVLAAASEARDASVAHQAIGLVLREFGDIEAAIAELRVARRFAVRAGSADREADVLGTLGFALVLAGRAAAGQHALDQAVCQAAGPLRGRALLCRGSCLRLLGDYQAAIDDLNSAIALLRAAGDQVWEARARAPRALPAGDGLDQARRRRLAAGGGAVRRLRPGPRVRGHPGEPGRGGAAHRPAARSACLLQPGG